MERIQRALDLARLQRDSLGRTAPPVEQSMPPLAPPIVDKSGTPAATVAVEHAALRQRRVVFADDHGAAASAYRMLRTRLLQQIRAHDVRAVGLVSAIDGEGKSLTAVNLALSLAAVPNQAVLLVDFDLRRPSISPLLGLDPRPGVETWMRGGASVEGMFVRLSGIERLAILPAFAPVARSSEALAESRTRDLMRELKGRYRDRIVLFDLPPALLADDVLTIAAELDGVLLIAAEGRTRRDDLARVREMLGSTRILGTVLNEATESETRAY